MMLVQEQTPFAVVDVETTGFAPRRDRIVEIAAVRVGPTGEIERNYCTLLNPGRDVGPTGVHGITASDVAGAPVFADILGDLIEHLRGCVVVGHNLRFDLSFISEETARAGVALPLVPSLCTLKLTRRLGLTLPRRKLVTCCEHAGIVLDAHTALGDAVATARLLVHYLGLARAAGLTSLAELGTEQAQPASEWPTWPPFGRTVTRGTVPVVSDEDSSFMRRVLARLEIAPDVVEGMEAYFDVLDRALEDRRVDAGEAEDLYEVARLWALTPADVLKAHRRYLRAVIDAALLDGVITPAEQKDAFRVSALLGLSRQTLDDVTAEARNACSAAVQVAAAASGKKASELTGKSICFTGALAGSVDGERITRAMAESMVSAAGLVVRDSVTRGLDILIVPDPATQSGKARKARDYGTRIMVEAELWRALGITVGLS